jgi:hypothetical protein
VFQRRVANVQRFRAEEDTCSRKTKRGLLRPNALSAQASEKRANDARDQADGLINFMLYDLRDKLEPIGRIDVLDDVVKAKEYLDGQGQKNSAQANLRSVRVFINCGHQRRASKKLVIAA